MEPKSKALKYPDKSKEAYVNSCKVWNEKYLIPYIEKEDENYYFLNYKKAEKEG